MRHPVPFVLFATVLGAGLTSCVRRGPNTAMVASAVVAPVTTSGTSGDTQVVVGADLSLAGADTDDTQSFYGRADLTLGGNGNGALSRQRIDGQVGYVLFDGDNHIFGRVGLVGAYEVDPLTGFAMLEAPTLWVGFQHHGSSRSDTLHVDVGPRASLAVAGRASALGSDVDMVAAPAIGLSLLVMDMAVVVDASAMVYFEEQAIWVGRASGCLAAGFAACVDLRVIRAAFSPHLHSTTYLGLRVGVGLANGLEFF